ncbi:E3 ubiquitin-protein ligase MARCHF3-like [Tribolium madens]|uniref:E3 ubiquitin-protein ligase MARCHF3-like n=1 Tax=Tribolium madens TaxID=41895 RepID=UPI001CF7606E|nr:E3 ubiquitin-protein ligase MARCHF3-like [Tribolium madens]
MITESTSAASDNDSVGSQRSLQMRGLPDIFASSNAVTRPLLAKKGPNCDEMCIHIDGKDYICRICHGGYSSGDLLTPCKCKGSIALAHLNCLEIWLNESNRNECELCQYHFRVVREPKYGILRSIIVFLRHPGDHFRELLVDIITLVVYTPSTVTSTYMLMLLCESMAKASPKFRKTILSHVMAFISIFGIAAINFTYTSWLVLTIEKYVDYWREWYKHNCSLRVILSANKLNANPALSNNTAST